MNGHTEAPRFECDHCGWEGSNVSTTEDKQVYADGTMVRSWHPLCPVCFRPAQRLGRLLCESA